ncbi:MAG TPA: hypothetical protein VFG06_03405, partial [Thermodesulfovibrionales bacterium]|nr:hypothetical protein [Thermodesulfovibrionales bacterium]
MDIKDTDKRRGDSPTSIRIPVSIWLATAAVIIFILLLAFTVNQTREKDIVEQFSRQQMAIARGTATGIEDFISSVEKSMILISRLPYVRGTALEATGQGIKVIYKDLGKMEFIEMPYVKGAMPEVTAQSIKVIYDDLDGKVEFIALEDRDGVVTTGYPPSALEGMLGKGFESRPYFPEIQKTGKPYISTLPLPLAGENDKEAHD